MIVENKGGAGGNIGADFVAKSEPDGHTLLVGFNGPIAVNVTLFKNLPYDPLKDLAPITLVVTTPQFLVVHPSVPAKNVKEFVALAQAAPGQALVRVGVDRQRLAPHDGDAEVGRRRSTVVHVPYKGAPPAMTDLLGGQHPRRVLRAGQRAAVREGGQASRHRHHGRASAFRPRPTCRR